MGITIERLTAFNRGTSNNRDESHALRTTDRPRWTINRGWCCFASPSQQSPTLVWLVRPAWAHVFEIQLKALSARRPGGQTRLARRRADPVRHAHDRALDG